jgi:hypothetical protein
MNNFVLSTFSEISCQVSDPFSHEIIRLCFHQFLKKSFALLVVLVFEVVTGQFIFEPLLFG